jgi:hypothetical protein
LAALFESPITDIIAKVRKDGCGDEQEEGGEREWVKFHEDAGKVRLEQR